VTGVYHRSPVKARTEGLRTSRPAERTGPARRKELTPLRAHDARTPLCERTEDIPGDGGADSLRGPVTCESLRT
jgi:hypothetical protein